MLESSLFFCDGRLDIGGHEGIAVAHRDCQRLLQTLEASWLGHGAPTYLQGFLFRFPPGFSDATLAHHVHTVTEDLLASYPKLDLHAKQS